MNFHSYVNKCLKFQTNSIVTSIAELQMKKVVLFYMLKSIREKIGLRKPLNQFFFKQKNTCLLFLQYLQYRKVLCKKF